jgi:hypothetical protein
MAIRMNLFRLAAILGGAGALAFATVTRADTMVCPPVSGAWSEDNLVLQLGDAFYKDCWLGNSYETAYENVGRGKIERGASGGNSREVWAYNFNNGTLHDYVRVRGVTLEDDSQFDENPNLTTCVAFDFSKNSQWGTPNTSSACFGTLYAYVQGWAY